MTAFFSITRIFFTEKWVFLTLVRDRFVLFIAVTRVVPGKILAGRVRRTRVWQLDTLVNVNALGIQSNLALVLLSESFVAGTSTLAILLFTLAVFD